MPINITMPALSPTMEEGNLAKWLVKEGDKVAPGDVIAEIETDKATMEVEAVDEGTVAKLVVAAGTEGVKVNAVIAILAAEGEDAGTAAKGSDARQPPAAAASKEPTSEKPKQAPLIMPRRLRANEAPSRSEPPAKAEATSKRDEGQQRVFASPLARRLAKDAGIDLSSVEGTGPHGRVVKADIEASARVRWFQAACGEVRGFSAPQASTAAPAPKGISDDTVLKLFEEGSYELFRMMACARPSLAASSRRSPRSRTSTLRSTARSMLSSACRKQLNDAAPTRKTEKGEQPAYKLSVNDLVIKAMAMALVAVPDANVSWTDAAMVKHKHADVGVAVSIPAGSSHPSSARRT